jgi:hypothetical protein
LLTGGQRLQGRVFFHEQVKQGSAWSDGIQIANDLPHGPARIAFFQAIGCIAGQPSSQGGIRLFDFASHTQAAQQCAKPSAFVHLPGREHRGAQAGKRLSPELEPTL